MMGRVSTLLVLSGVGALLALLGAATRLGDRTPAPGSSPDPAAAPMPVEAEVAAEEPLEVRRASLGRGGTIAGALEGLGLEPALRQRVLEAVGTRLDMRRLAPGTGVAVAVGPSGRVRTVSVRNEAERFVRVTLAGDGTPEATPVPLPVATSIETAGGVVESSVAQALSAREHAARLTRSYADIFQWDVDLLVDPRPGDQVRLAYEVKRLGKVPRDLPRFEGSAESPGELLGLGRILAASYEGRLASATAYWVDEGDGGGDYYDDQGRPLRKSFLKSPLDYRRISSRFSRSRRHPVTRKAVPHHGVDFAAAPGTPVAATGDGRVIRAGWDGALGRAVRIRHGGGYVTIYGHLRGFARGVRVGVEVEQGQVIGYVGSTGRATGPHLHYTVLQYDRPIDPLRMENPPVKPLRPELLPWLAESKRRLAPVLDSIRLASAPTLAGRGASSEAFRAALTTGL